MSTDGFQFALSALLYGSKKNLVSNLWAYKRASWSSSEHFVRRKPFPPFSGCPEKNRVYHFISSYTSFWHLTVSCNKHSTYLCMCNMEILFPISECGALFPKKDYFSYLYIDVSPLFWDFKMICELSTLQQLIRLHFLTYVTSTSIILCSHLNEILPIDKVIFIFRCVVITDESFLCCSW